MIELKAEEYERLVAQRYDALMEVGHLRGFIQGCADVIDDNPDFVKRYIKEKSAEIDEAVAKEKRS